MKQGRTSSPSPEIQEMLAYLGGRESHESDASLLDSLKEDGDLSREVGRVYERIRYAVDNKEEHFLRRHAVRRIIRRTSLFNSDPEKVLRILLGDLIRGGYLHESAITVHMHDDALRAIRAFVLIEGALRAEFGTSAHQYRPHLLDIVAGSLEDALYDTEKEEGIVVFCARTVEKRIVSDELSALTPDKLRRVVYVASWRSVFTADNSLLFYKLWMLDHPKWESVDDESARELAKAFPRIATKIIRFAQNKLSTRLIPRLHDTAIAMTLLYDAVDEYGPELSGLLADRELFEARIRDFLTARHKKDIARAKRRSSRAVIYIALTKTTLALLIESVYVILLHNTLNVVATGFNIIAHPLLLFFITSGMTPSSKSNSDRSVRLASAIAYGDDREPVVLKRERGGIVADIALGCYIALLTGSVYAITRALLFLRFHAVDILIFFLFLVLVLYFGFRIRFRAHRMRFSGANEGFLRSLFEILLLPLISLGRSMSIHFEKINIVVFFLDFVIEAPLRLALRFMDSFSLLIREKKEEIFS